MRWLNDPLKDRMGEERVIIIFLLFPKRIGNEWRWLEKAKIRQRVMKVDIGGSMEWGKYKGKWRNLNWEKDHNSEIL